MSSIDIMNYSDAIVTLCFFFLTLLVIGSLSLIFYGSYQRIR